MSEKEQDGKACPPCGKFEPQAWRKSICRNCFHTSGEHNGDLSHEGGKTNAAGTKKENTPVSDKPENKVKVTFEKDKSKSVSPEKVVDKSKTQKSQAQEKHTSVFLNQYEKLSESMNKGQDKSKSKEPLPRTSGGLAAKFTDKYEKLGGSKSVPEKTERKVSEKDSKPPEKTETKPSPPPVAPKTPPPVLPKTRGKSPLIDHSHTEQDKQKPGNVTEKKDPKAPEKDKSGWKSLSENKSDLKQEARKDEKSQPSSDKTNVFKNKYESLTQKAKFGSAENLSASISDNTTKPKLNVNIKVKFGSAENVSLTEKKSPTVDGLSPKPTDRPWDMKVKTESKDKVSIMKSTSLQDISSESFQKGKDGLDGKTKAITITTDKPIRIDLKPKAEGSKTTEPSPKIIPIKQVGKSEQDLGLKVENKELKLDVKSPSGRDQKPKLGDKEKSPVSKIGSETKDHKSELESKFHLKKSPEKQDFKAKFEPESKSDSITKVDEKGSKGTAKLEDRKSPDNTILKSKGEQETKAEQKSKVGETIDKHNAAKTEDTKASFTVDLKTKAGKESEPVIKSKSEETDKAKMTKFEEKTGFNKTKFGKESETELKLKSDEKDKTSLTKGYDTKNSESKSELKIKFDDKLKTALSKSEDDKKAEKSKSEKDSKSDLKSKFDDKDKKPFFKLDDMKKTDKAKFEKDPKSELKSKFDDKDKKSLTKVEDIKKTDNKLKQEDKPKVAGGIKLNFGNQLKPLDTKSKPEEKDAKSELKSKFDQKKTDVKTKFDDKDKKPSWRTKMEEKDNKPELKSKLDEKKSALFKVKIDDKDKKTDYKSKLEDKKFELKSKTEDKTDNKSKFSDRSLKDGKTPFPTLNKTPEKSKAENKVDVKSTTDKRQSEVKQDLKSDSNTTVKTDKDVSVGKAAITNSKTNRDRSPFASKTFGNVSPASEAKPDDVTDASAVASTRSGTQSDFTSGEKPTLYVDTQVFTSSKSKSAGDEVADRSSSERKGGVSSEISSDSSHNKTTDRKTDRRESGGRLQQNGAPSAVEAAKVKTDIVTKGEKTVDDIEKLKAELKLMSEKCHNLETENETFRKDIGAKNMAETSLKKQKDEVENTLKGLQNQLRILEETCSKLETDNTNLMEKLRTQQENNNKPVTKEVEETECLSESERICEELTEENETLKQEIQDLKVEMEEMYDSFRDQEAEEFRELQKELEITAKNCRILQFKMRKAERRNEQIESDRNLFEEKLRMLQNQFDNKDAVSHIRSLEEELKMAKDVSVRLHDELDLMDDKRGKLEDENRQLTELLEQADRKQFRLEMEVDKLRDQLMDLRHELASRGGGSRTDDHNERKFRF